jgi:regulatory protein
VDQLRKKLTPTEAKQKIYRYCAYQERSHNEVRSKLCQYGLVRNETDEILSQLITEGFLNEERFAKAFAGGKFRMKHWGRLKIIHELESKGLTKNCIKAGLKEIDDQKYIATLNNLLTQKAGTLNEKDAFVRKDKLSKYAIQKGFEPELVWSILKESTL